MTRVLLAEDDTSISEPLSRALRREGYQVEITEDGPTTLGRALSDGIDLILLDIGLPELDGLEFRQPDVEQDEVDAIRKRPFERRRPVLGDLHLIPLTPQRAR